MPNLFCMPHAIISGENALENAGSKFARMGKRALIVSDSTMQKLGNIDKVAKVLASSGISFSIYSEVDSEPTDKTVEAGVAAYKAGGCDFLVAIGGGSPIDTMKAIALIAVLGGVPADYFGKEIQASLPPMAAISTTAGTGSESTQFTIISDLATNVKMLLKGVCLLPDLAVVDPVFTLTAPAAITAFTGVDALCHCVEAYTSRKSQPLSDTFALSAIKRIFGNLLTAYQEPGNLSARTQMALASTEAGIAFNNSSVTIIHGMSRPIGALFHVPHGLSNAMLMEPCLKFARKGAETRFACVARYCGMTETGTLDSAAADCFMNRLAALLGKLTIPSPREYGICKEEFYKYIPKMAADAEKSGSPGNTLADVTIEDMEKIYCSLWD